MMTPRHRIVVVAPSPPIARVLIDALATAGHGAILFRDFPAARAALDDDPADLVFSEVRLGAYNGMHLAIRCRSRGARGHIVLLGAPDPVLEGEAVRQHAIYMVTPIDPAAVLELTQRLLQEVDSGVPVRT